MQRKENNFNQRKIAKFILKKGETSKQEIASELGLSMPTVLQNVKELVQNGLVIETGKYESTGGRKAAVPADNCIILLFWRDFTMEKQHFLEKCRHDTPRFPIECFQSLCS